MLIMTTQKGMPGTEFCDQVLLTLSNFCKIHSPSLGGPITLYRLQTESNAVRTQSSDTATTPTSIDSEGSNDHLLQPSPPAPVGSPNLMYAQLESVKHTQVQPPASDDPVQYAQIEHQD